MKNIYDVNNIRDKACHIAKNHGVKKLFLFGSYARNEATEKSDIDLVIDNCEPDSLFGLSSLKIDLENSLKKSVDILSESCLKPEFANAIKNDRVIFYDETE
ncbi:MAG: nucleotidyltransferase domain-containing protein [Oscillospiraceae bacterium]|jgi:predicted nucleotidyltransferase|nr:nucleotidyltransferase domain-containing protein [Oscillospiraceae bacterium]